MGFSEEDPGDGDYGPALVELVGLLPGAETFEDTLRRITGLACRTVPGCEHASVSVVTGHARTVARTDDVALRTDELQYATGRGPCLDAARKNAVVDAPCLAEERRWGGFPARAVASGVLGVLALPLAVHGEAIGALNLYARTEHAFTPEAHDVGVAFAAQAAVALANARVLDTSRRLVAQIEEAMVSRSVIEQAKGILMVERHCDDTAAFDLLRTASQRENVKLREVARRLVHSTAPHPGAAVHPAG
jgi:GAF domain-containing protein